MTNRCRILYLTSQLPWPPDNGQKVVTLSDLSVLSRFSVIDLVSYIDISNYKKMNECINALQYRLPNVNFVKPVVHNILGVNSLGKAWTFLVGQTRRLPFVVSKYYSNSYISLTKQMLKSNEYDVIYVEGLSVCYVADVLFREKLVDKKIVYRAFDVFSETLFLHYKELKPSLQKIAVWFDYLVCKNYELKAWRQFDMILTVTERLARTILDSIRDEEKLVYFPVLVDVTKLSARRKPLRSNLLYVGTVHYPPNLQGLKWFIEKCWPFIKDRVPDATFDIVGRGGELLFPVPEGITIHGYVEDVRPFYEKATMFIVPLFAGSGIRLKILDAMAHHVPIVSTTIGFSGLDLVHGKELLVADDSVSFANNVISLIEDEDLQRKLVERGVQFIRNNHSSEAVRFSNVLLQRVLG